MGSLNFGNYFGVDAKKKFKKKSKSGLKHKMLSLLRLNTIIFLMEDPFKASSLLSTHLVSNQHVVKQESQNSDSYYSFPL